MLTLQAVRGNGTVGQHYDLAVPMLVIGWTFLFAAHIASANARECRDKAVPRSGVEYRSYPAGADLTSRIHDS
jgi:hypothetical protein